MYPGKLPTSRPLTSCNWNTSLDPDQFSVSGLRPCTVYSDLHYMRNAAIVPEQFLHPDHFSMHPDHFPTSGSLHYMRTRSLPHIRTISLHQDHFTTCGPGHLPTSGPDHFPTSGPDHFPTSGQFPSIQPTCFLICCTINNIFGLN